MNKFVKFAVISLAGICTSALAANMPVSSVTAPTAAPSPSATTILPPPPNLDAHGYVLMDANSGSIIAQKNMNDRMAPASLTKLMSLYLVFTALKNGQIQLNNKVLISKKAWKTGGSRMFVRVGTLVSVQDLIRGVIVDSGNDAVTALSQFVGGTETSFVGMMNQAAKQLDMTNTHFMDATGLPVDEHYSTPHDLALLTRAIIHEFPQYYHFFDEKWFKYNGIRQPNRNRLLWRDTWVDGLKTGHTKEAGYCLITSGLQNGMRLISVMMGTPTDAARADDSQALLNWGFRFFQTYTLYNAGAKVTQTRVWLGKDKYTQLGVNKNLFITIPKGEYKLLKAKSTVEPNLHAPLHQGATYGTLTVTLNGKTITTAPLVALQANPEGGFWSRLGDHIHLLFAKWF